MTIRALKEARFEQVQLSAAVYLALDELQAVDVALGLAVRPGLGDGSAHGSKIPGDAAGKDAIRLAWRRRATDRNQPRPCAGCGLEALDQGAGFGQGWRAFSIAATVSVSVFVRWSRFSVIRRTMVRTDGGLRSWALVMRSERRRCVAPFRDDTGRSGKAKGRRRRQSGRRCGIPIHTECPETVGGVERALARTEHIRALASYDQANQLALRPVRRTISLIEVPLAASSATMAFVSSRRR